MFNVNQKDLKRLRGFYARKGPSLFQVTTAEILNAHAFGTRKKSLGQIERGMNVRNPRFVQSRLRVSKARPKPINRQFSEVGSIATRRFSGWVEQELGTRTERTRLFSIGARRGSWGKQAISEARARPGNRFIGPNDFNINAKTEEHRIAIFLRIMFKTKEKKPFIVPRRYKRMPKGIYKRVGNKLRRYQNLEPKRVQPKRFKWLTNARNDYAKSVNVERLWASKITRVIRRA